MTDTFHTVATITASRDRLYHPEMYRKGDALTVGVIKWGRKWSVIARNTRGEKVNSIVNRNYADKSYAVKKAKEFAKFL